MTEITRDHAEWAVVDRLRAMLNETPHAQYNVTQSYGLCVTILAWVMQRVQTPENQDNSQEDLDAIKVKTKLDSQKVEAAPWGLTTNDSAQSDFKNFSSFDFLKWLRDASCHGDARKVFPENIGGALIGFKFRMTACKQEGKKKVKDVERSITLTECDLRRIGSALADMYCEALKNSDSFAADARSMPEKNGADA